MRLWGSEMFYGHLMSGAAGAVPSFLSSPTGGVGAGPAVAQGPGFKTIQRHEPVLVDYLFAYNGYLSDHTRIFSLGSLPDELINAHAAMLEVQQMVQKLAKPGVKAGDIYDRALEKTKISGMPTFSWASAMSVSALSATVSDWKWMNILFWQPDSSLNCRRA